MKCLESRKGLNMAKQHQHAHAFRMFGYSIREKKMSELQAGRHIAETCYGDSAIGVLMHLQANSGTGIVPVQSLSDIVTS